MAKLVGSFYGGLQKAFNEALEEIDLKEDDFQKNPGSKGAQIEKFVFQALGKLNLDNVKYDIEKGRYYTASSEIQRIIKNLGHIDQFLRMHPAFQQEFQKGSGLGESDEPQDWIVGSDEEYPEHSDELTTMATVQGWGKGNKPDSWQAKGKHAGRMGRSGIESSDNERSQIKKNLRGFYGYEKKEH